MGKHEFAKRIQSEPANIHSVGDRAILNTIACDGFRQKFDMSSYRPTQKRIRQVNGGFGEDQMGTITKKDGTLYRTHIIRDLDNYGVIITGGSTNSIATKVILRERAHDGSPESGSPYYLSCLDQISGAQIPIRSYGVGYTNWSYSNPRDALKPGESALELSIVSSDPDRSLLRQLLKKNSLFVNAIELAKYIDDPFAYIPFPDPKDSSQQVDQNSINLWWKYWFQVVDRGMRGKEIPHPGQTSQRGFEGFFTHTLKMTEELAKKTNHTHLTAIPTWLYVWHAFRERGYEPVDAIQNQEMVEFINQLNTITLPNQTTIRDLSPKHPLTSWLAVAPFVMQLNPQFTPQLGIDETRENRFKHIYSELNAALCVDGLVKTYPFYPGYNLWICKKL